MKYIMCAKLFPVYHPRAGEPTRFRESILNGTKIHTIRGSAGNRKTGDIVSLREWTGRPYASKQEEFCQSRIMIEPFSMHDECWVKTMEIAKNDGLEVRDFQMWFTRGKDITIQLDGVRIWFDNIKKREDQVSRLCDDGLDHQYLFGICEKCGESQKQQKEKKREEDSNARNDSGPDSRKRVRDGRTLD